MENKMHAKKFVFNLEFYLKSLP